MFLPIIEGELPVKATYKQFKRALQRRVEQGFLNESTGPRQDYKILECEAPIAAVRAGNWLTAINVGMNNLVLDLSDPEIIRYRLSYWRWTAYGVGLGMLLGLIAIGIFSTIDIRQYIAKNPTSKIPGLSIDQNVYFAWGSVVFWAFIWPWILVVLHKRPLRRLVAKVVAEVDETANGKDV